VHQDIHNIHTTLARHETRMDRIENRLELREFQEAQLRFEPQP
jgi:predicted component of type VI protein secretion system